MERGRAAANTIVCIVLIALAFLIGFYAGQYQERQNNPVNKVKEMINSLEKSAVQ